MASGNYLPGRQPIVKRGKELAALTLMFTTAMIIRRFSLISKALNKNITERTKLEDELKKCRQQLTAALMAEQKMRMEQKRFLDMISHEYRTPLAIIQANIDIIEFKDQHTDHAIYGSLAKMRQAVERLVDIFRITRNGESAALEIVEPTLETIGINQFYNETLVAIADICGERLVSLNNSLHEGWLCADMSLLRTALINLVGNAVKYSPPNQPVTLHIDITGDQLELTVRNCPSIPLRRDTEALFQKFSRGANSAGTSGTGQGLYDARNIAEQHGGSLELMLDEIGYVVAMMKLPLAAVPEES